MQSAHAEAAPGPQYPQFQFIEFNPRRKMRGAEAARVEVIHSEGDHEELWMSPRDLRANIKLYGQHEALTKALAAYQNGGQP
ncbi:hypothetical protein [Vreelandella sp. EE7]